MKTKEKLAKQFFQKFSQNMTFNKEKGKKRRMPVVWDKKPIL